LLDFHHQHDEADVWIRAKAIVWHQARSSRLFSLR
jgi:hypothetical protein